MNISNIIGKRCCRSQVGRSKSLSLGFGEKVFHGKNLIDDFYGEWEIGCFGASWRITNDRSIIYGALDSYDSNKEMDCLIKEIEFGSIVSIRLENEADVRVCLSSGLSVEFLLMSSDDESFHIFGPDEFFFGYDPSKGWQVGTSHQSAESFHIIERDLVADFFRGK